MNAQDIRDIKPPLYFIDNYPWLLALAAALLLAALLLFLIRYWRRRLKQKKPDNRPPKSAEQIAYEALAALAAKNLPAQGKFKEYYYELSDIVRYYIENRFEIKAPDMTTEEFLVSLNYAQKLSAQHKQLLQDFLTLCDIVKFAKYGPTLIEVENSFTAAKRLVDETRTVAKKQEKPLK